MFYNEGWDINLQRLCFHSDLLVLLFRVLILFLFNVHIMLDGIDSLSSKKILGSQLEVNLTFCLPLSVYPAYEIHIPINFPMIVWSFIY
jgi:high-affinity Fe2+/Pb2+ permease